MFEILPRGETDIVGVKASGKLGHDDYRRLIPELEAIIEEHGPVRMLVDLEDFQGWEARAAWDDLMFGLRHWNDFQKLAVVGEKGWESFTAKLADKLMRAEVRFYPTGERDDAWEWLIR